MEAPKIVPACHQIEHQLGETKRVLDMFSDIKCGYNFGVSGAPSPCLQKNVITSGGGTMAPWTEANIKIRVNT